MRSRPNPKRSKARPERRPKGKVSTLSILQLIASLVFLVAVLVKLSIGSGNIQFHRTTLFLAIASLVVIIGVNLTQAINRRKHVDHT